MKEGQSNNVASWAVGSALLALIFNFLFFDKLPGIAVFVYGVLLLAALFWFAHKQGLNLRPALWLSAVFLFFCFMPAVRDNEFLLVLNIAVAMGAFILMTRVVTGEKIFSFSFLDYLLTPLWPLKFLRNAFRALGALLRGAKDMPAGNGRRAIIGALAALPVLIFFGALFASADLAFRQFLQNIFSFNLPDTLLPQIVLIVAVFIACLGLLAFLANVGRNPKTDFIELFGFSAKPVGSKQIEAMVFLSLVAALFLVFIIFQIQYLFGGAANISLDGYTYAEYARKGFGELVVVAISTLLILLAVDHYGAARERSPWFIAPSLFVIAEVLVIIVSAFQRLALYQSAYGQTLARLFVSGAIILIGALFLWLAVKIILRKPHAFFAAGVLVGLILFGVSLNLLNPDKFVAEQNLQRYHETGKIDGVYLTSLSADAVPVILQNYDIVSALTKSPESEVFTPPDRQTYITEQIQALERDSHWQSFNFARDKALNVLQGR